MSHYSPPPPPPRHPRRPSAARPVCAIFALLTGIALALTVWLTIGDVEALIVFAMVLIIGVYGAAAAPRPGAIAIALLLLGGFVVSTLFVGQEALAIYRAVNETDGPVDPADPQALASADAKIDDASDTAGFTVALHESEITSVLQNGLRELDENPIRRVSADVVDGRDGEPGRIVLSGVFKSGNMKFEGQVTIRITNGAAQVKVLKLEVGALDLPGIGRDALEDILAEVADLNDVLLDLRADVQAITIGDDQIVVTGTHPEGTLTSADLLAGLADRARSLASGGPVPPEIIGPGEVDGVSAEGTSYYVAIGDSLAANVGVPRPRLGYVSRVHKALQERDDRRYGLRNFGVSGETSGTLIRSGQLEQALGFMDRTTVDYVTIDIGANDLLAHLGSDDCSDDIDSKECRDRIDAAFATYEVNIAEIFTAMRRVAPDATIVFMTAYNPFSLGLEGVTFERRSDQILDEFNQIAAAAAADHRIVVADAFRPMRGTTGVTTHMLDNPPDIHPLPIGYDVLAVAVMEALAGLPN
jgi:lysophospholipase L1-like esterase